MLKRGQCAAFPFSVDAVFTWVDGNDPVWLAKRQARQQELGIAENNSDALGTARFCDNNELLFALRSIALYAPWIRKVHLVTADQCPGWLNTATVNLVPHTAIFPDQTLLPVFSTRPVELCVHRIPDLAEHFLYFNDDFMLGRPVTPDNFFQPSGDPVVWAAKLRSHRLKKRHCPKGTSHGSAIDKSSALIESRFGMEHPYRMRHFPKAMTVSSATEVWETFSDEVAHTLASPFRSSSDITMTMLYPLYLLSTGKGVVRQINGIRHVLDALCGGVCHMGASLGDDNLKIKMKMISLLRPKTFCLNDSLDATTADRDLLQAFLYKHFSTPSPYEISTEPL